MEDIKKEKRRSKQYGKKVAGYISIGLHAEMLEKIKTLARSRGQTNSSMITFILCEYFDKIKLLEVIRLEVVREKEL